MTAWLIPSAWLLAPLLVAVILYDLRFMRLPNGLSWLFVAVFLATLPTATSWGAVGIQVALAAAVFALGVAGNAAKLLGGGDVKVLAAFALHVPPQGLLLFSGLLCATLVVGIVALVMLRRGITGPTRWKALNETARYPAGLSIGMAGLIYLALA